MRPRSPVSKRWHMQKIKRFVTDFARSIGVHLGRASTYDSLVLLRDQLQERQNQLLVDYAKLESLFLQSKTILSGTASELRGARRDLEITRRDLTGHKGALHEALTNVSRYRDLLRIAERPAGRGRQLVYLHIQKTGGNSLLNFVASHFPWSSVLQVYSPAEFDTHPRSEVAHFDLICGHITARNLSAVAGDAIRCTVLREPVDRTLSSYWYFRTYKSTPPESIRHAVASAKANSLTEFLRNRTPEVRRHVVNHQAHCLAGDWSCRMLGADELLAAAIENLHTFHWVGITEQLDEGARQLAQVMGWDLPARLSKENVTPCRQHADELRSTELNLIQELVMADSELYRAAAVAANVNEMTPLPRFEIGV